MKSNSSKWVREKGKNFSWQQGYGAFSVSRSNIPKVVRYIDNQAEHLRKMSYEDEYIALLEKHRVPYDPRYVFD